MNTLELQDALSVLNETIETEPNRAELHFQAGNIQKKLGNLKAAAMAYARAVELDGDYVPAYNNLGIVFYEMGEKNKALNMFRRGIALQEDNSLLQSNYRLALEGGDNPAAKMIPAGDDETKPGVPESPVPAEAGEPETGPEAGPEAGGVLKSDLIGLMYYLRDLSGGLTGKSREVFAHSDARLGLEYIINILEGRKGLLREIRDQFSPEEPAVAEPEGGSSPKDMADSGRLLSTGHLISALNYLRNLAEALPDQDLGAAIGRKVNRVIKEIDHSPPEDGDIHGQ
ncbi:MAG: tetratricopeptide repeat protein [Treponema sp.]|jgi:tetratricopeptide (TPR) repeat protein|nr:tetratricopeptide repeat protein [Treponema sp.]